MRKLFALAIILGIWCSLTLTAIADPMDDQRVFQNYFKDKFPDVEYNDFINGVYSIDSASRDQWEAIEEFPPYELSIEEGERIFGTPFSNGRLLGDCFPNSGIGIAHLYPLFDTNRNEVITLELAINECRERNGEKKFKYKKGSIAAVSAYMRFTARGKVINIEIPNEAANDAYDQGKQFYYARRGQLNMACAHCHVDNSGKRVRAELLSPGLGHTTHFPVYRSKWGSMGTLHRRFVGCNKQVRAKPFPAQSAEYRNLEYFLTFMSNGLRSNGPGVRK